MSLQEQSHPGRHPQERMILWLLAVIQFTNVLDFVVMMPLGPQFMRVFQISPTQFGTRSPAIPQRAQTVSFSA